MRFAVFFLFFLFAASVSCPEGAGGASAETYFLQGKWAKAAEAYKALADKNPTVYNFIRLADSYLYSGALKDARKACRKAFGINNDPDAAICLALLDALDDGGEAKLTGLFEGYGDNPMLWRAAGVFYLKIGEHNKAMYYFRGAIDKDPGDYMSYFYTGLIHELHLEFDEAIESYKKVVEINPEFAMALNNLGYAYKERHYYTYAIDMYARAIAADPDNAGFYYNIGNAYAHKNMIKEAFDSYKTALKLAPTFAKAHYNMGQTYLRMGNRKEALKEFELYLKYWDKSIPVADAPHPDAVKVMIEEIKAPNVIRDPDG